MSLGGGELTIGESRGRGAYYPGESRGREARGGKVTMDLIIDTSNYRQIFSDPSAVPR